MIRERTSRVAATALLLAATMLGPFGAGSALAAQHGPVTLTFWVLNSFTSSPSAALYKAIREFHARYPYIRVHVDPVAANTLHDKYITAVSGGGGPDVVSFDIAWAGQFIDAHLLKDVTKSLAPQRHSFFPGPLGALTKDGHQYAVPWYTNNLALYYNANAFHKSAIAHPPTTWAQFSADAKLLKSHGYDALSLARGGFGTYFFLSFLYENGGHVYGPNRKKLVIDSPADVQAFEWFTSLYTKLHAVPQSVKSAFSWDEVYAPFIQGKAAMFISGDWAESTLASSHLGFHWSIAPMPREKKFATVAGGYNLGIGAHSRHPASAWKLIRFLTGKKREWLLESYDRIPARIDVLHSAYATGNHFVNLFVRQARYAVPQPSDPSWPQISNLIGNAFDAVIQGTQTAPAALRRVEQEGQPIVAGSFAK